MFVKTEPDLSKQIAKHTKHLRTQALKSIVATAGVSPVRVPMVEIDFSANGFTLEVEMLEKLPASCNLMSK